MPSVGPILVLVVIFALVFDYINGFHDTANAIATVVSTRVLTPLQAILMAGILNFVGAVGIAAIVNTILNHLFRLELPIAQGTMVAQTIAKELVTQANTTDTVALAAVFGGIVWNLLTWRYGIPSSSSHALIGGLCGAALAHGGAATVKWGGLLGKVVIPLVMSPIAGFVFAFILMRLITLAFAYARPNVGKGFRWLQMLSSATMAYAHGSNDAQKSMGLITLALVSTGLLKKPEVPIWVIVACATVMGLGTAAGGWRIIRTMGHRIIRLEPVSGFAAECSGATVILTATHFGMPVSTTHCIAGSIFGVGAAKRKNAVRWGVAQTMVAAWVITIPAAALVGAVSYYLLQFCGL